MLKIENSAIRLVINSITKAIAASEMKDTFSDDAR